MRAALVRCQMVADGKAWCALLLGKPGNGKTHLSIAALNRWLERGNAGYFWKVPDWLAWLKRFVFDEQMMPLDLALENYRRMGLLVFDDLGAENATDWASEQLYRVIDARYDAKAPTIVTSNQPPARIDQRILSRLRSGLVVCEGDDMRAVLG